jgi:hypothetical protein
MRHSPRVRSVSYVSAKLAKVPAALAAVREVGKSRSAVGWSVFVFVLDGVKIQLFRWLQIG